MDLPRNGFKAALAEGRLQIGLWSNLCSPITTEIVAASGFDWLLLDTEHAPNEVPGLLVQMQAAATGTAAIIVRPAWNDAVLIKRVLDIGAQTVLVPFVQSAAEAEQAARACQYPLRGMRGVTASSRASRYGRVADYLKRADRETCLLVQIETATALAQLEDIAGVAGVDGVFIGPADLSASMGHLGEPLHPEVQAEIKDAGARLQAAGTPAGILTPSEADARRYIEWGYRFVAVGSDSGLLAKAADQLAATFKAADPQRA